MEQELQESRTRVELELNKSCKRFIFCNLKISICQIFVLIEVYIYQLTKCLITWAGLAFGRRKVESLCLANGTYVLDLKHGYVPGD